MRYFTLFLTMLFCCSTFATPLVTTNLLLNPGAEENSLTNWTVGGVSNPRIDNGTFDSGIKPHSGTNDFLGGSGASGSLSQVVTLAGNQGITTGAIDGGGLFAFVSFWEQGLSQGTPSDDAYASLVFMGASSNSIATWASPEIDSHFSAWSNYSTYLPIPAGTRFIQYSMNFVRHSGTDLDAFLDDNVLIVRDSIPAPPVLYISGSATNTLVYWPAQDASGYALVQETNLDGTNWTAVGNPVTTVNGTNQVTISPLLNSQFFRLYHP